MFAALRSAYWEARLRGQQLSWRVRHDAMRLVRAMLGIPRAVNLHSMWTVRHTDARGRLLWAGFGRNMLHDEGEQFILQVVFSEVQTPPAAYYIGLDARTSLAEADNLAALVDEPPGTYGYARKAVNSDATDFTISQESGDYQALTKTVTFTAAGGAIGPVTKAFLCTVVSGTSGKLIQSVALSQSRTLQSGESLNVSMYLRLSE